MSAPRVFADFHNADERGRVRLNCVGTVQDLNVQKIQLRPGLVLRLYSEDIETDGTVEYSDLEHLWVASVDWAAIFGGLPSSLNGAAPSGETRTSD
jgi:hypothetical protein